MNRKLIQHITIAGLLIAVGILIPLTFPRIAIEPASYTLASHVAIFVAMFISPGVALGVALGTTFGFFMTATPIIALRAASHLIYAIPFAFYIAKANPINLKGLRLRVLSLMIAIVHALAETTVVMLFYFGTAFPEGQGAMWVMGFIGIGTVFHSLLDFELANIVRRGLQRARLLVA